MKNRLAVGDLITGMIVVILWGLNFIAIKVGLRDVPPLMLGAIRFLAVTLPGIFFIPRPPVDWRWLIALGLTINVGQFSFLFFGMKAGMPAGLASLVLQAQAFFTLLIAVAFLKERWHWNNVTGLFLAACGMAIIGWQQDASMNQTGFWFTVCAAASWGLGNVIMRKISNTTPKVPMFSLVVWAGAVAIVPLMLLSWWIEGPSLWQAAWNTVSLDAVGAIIYLAYFATLGGYGLWGRLLSRHPAAVVSPFALLVPLVGLSSSNILLGEALSRWQALGVVTVMIGLLIHVFGSKIIKVSVAKENMHNMEKLEKY